MSTGPTDQPAWMNPSQDSRDTARQRMWHQYGFTSDESAAWQAVPMTGDDTLFDAPTMAAEWRRAGFKPSEAQEWIRHRFWLWEASSAWRSAGFEPPEASAWRDEGWSPPDASRWRRGTFSPQIARRWADRGLDPESAGPYFLAGMTNPERVRLALAGGIAPNDALAWQEQRIEAAASWRSMRDDRLRNRKGWYPPAPKDPHCPGCGSENLIGSEVEQFIHVTCQECGKEWLRRPKRYCPRCRAEAWSGQADVLISSVAGFDFAEEVTIHYRCPRCTHSWSEGFEAD
jgi:ribosomal protein L37E